METRRLGRTDLEISVLSIGGLYTSSLAGGVAETQRIMRRAIELGINAIDNNMRFFDPLDVRPTKPPVPAPRKPTTRK